MLGFGLGAVAGVLLRRRREADHPARRGDEAFFKGVQYILSNDHDHAIEEFTKSVQIDSETIETYVALGNLYRSVGDIDRAIRIRQSIILRPNIDEGIKVMALYDLGLDYHKGGFLNRALKTFLQVLEKKPADLKALKMVERIYEELRDWERAYRTRQKISRLTKQDHLHILAHYLVEQGKVQQQAGDVARAISLFKKAISTDRTCIDAYLHLGDLYLNTGDLSNAISSWEKAVDVAPRFTFLVYHRLEKAYSTMSNRKPLEAFLRQCTEQHNSDAFAHLALARYLYRERDIEGALKEASTALEVSPHFWEARKFKGEILLSQGREKEVLDDYGGMIEYLNMPYLKFQCAQCGFEPAEFQWQCPQCRHWDTIDLVDSKDLQKRPRVEFAPRFSTGPEPKGED